MLLARGLIREEVTEKRSEANAAVNAFWRNRGDGRGILAPHHACHARGL